MNPASEARLARARQVAGVYAGRTGVAAIIVGGSVALGWADRWSDVEIVVMWDALPAGATLATLAARAGAADRRVFPAERPGDALVEEWVDRGLKVDVSHQTVAALDRIVGDVVERHETDWSKQAQLVTIRDGIVLHGDAVVETWRERTVYSDGLARAMVEAHLAFGPQAWLEMLADRDDALYLAALSVEVERRLVGVLLGLNRRYPPAGTTKWAVRVARELAIAPDGLADRLVSVLRAEAVEGVRELGRLIDETIGLVERHMPGIDTAPVRARIAERRPVWDGA